MPNLVDEDEAEFLHKLLVDLCWSLEEAPLDEQLHSLIPRRHRAHHRFVCGRGKKTRQEASTKQKQTWRPMDEETLPSSQKH